MLIFRESLSEKIMQNFHRDGICPIRDVLSRLGDKWSMLVLVTLNAIGEPTTGLHFADVHRLIEVLQKLVDAGNTVIVIEHNLDLIKCADHIIDLGPEGGSAGGLIVAEGTPEQVAEVPGSFTGQYLKPLLEKDAKLRAEGK